MKEMLALVLLLSCVPALGAEPPRDPFAAYESAPIAAGDGPLQRWPLEALRLRGVISGTASPRALIETPDGQTHTARVGDHVGTAWGRIAAIRGGAIAVQEQFRDAIGALHERRTELALPRARATGATRPTPTAAPIGR